MPQLAVISTDAELNAAVINFCAELDSAFRPVALEDERRVMEFLNYELPELSVINLADQDLAIDEILRAIQADPWLHYGGLVRGCDR